MKIWLLHKKKTDRYSFRQIIDSNLNNFDLLSYTNPASFSCLFNYEIFSDNKFIIYGTVSVSHGSTYQDKTVSKTYQLPFNIGKVININFSRIDSEYGPSKNISICFKPFKSSIQIITYQDSNDDDNRWSFEIYGEI